MLILCASPRAWAIRTPRCRGGRWYSQQSRSLRRERSVREGRARAESRPNELETHVETLLERTRTYYVRI